MKLRRAHRTLIGVVTAGAAVIAAIGFAGSYAAVRDLAEQKGFGDFAPFFPIGVDAGIVVLLALDLVMTALRIPFPLLRQTAWLLTAATIAFNAAAADDALGVGMHAIIPVLFVVSVEAARHAVGRIANITADRHMEGIRFSRWLLAFPSTFRLWKRMKLWELRSYDDVIRMEQDRLIYETRLHARYGRNWRRRAPVEALMPLKLVRYGIPLKQTAVSGLHAAGIETPPDSPSSLPAGPTATGTGQTVSLRKESASREAGLSAPRDPADISHDHTVPGEAEHTESQETPASTGLGPETARLHAEREHDHPAAAATVSHAHAREDGLERPASQLEHSDAGLESHSRDMKSAPREFQPSAGEWESPAPDHQPESAYPQQESPAVPTDGPVGTAVGTGPANSIPVVPRQTANEEQVTVPSSRRPQDPEAQEVPEGPEGLEGLEGLEFQDPAASKLKLPAAVAAENCYLELTAEMRSSTANALAPYVAPQIGRAEGTTRKALGPVIRTARAVAEIYQALPEEERHQTAEDLAPRIADKIGVPANTVQKHLAVLLSSTAQAELNS